jgi:hypothetical protein
MGRTRREQLMLEVIDPYLAEDVPPSLHAQEERRQHVLERLIVAIDRQVKRGELQMNSCHPPNNRAVGIGRSCSQGDGSVLRISRNSRPADQRSKTPR